MALFGLAGATSALADNGYDAGWYLLVGAGQVTDNNDKSTLDSTITSLGGSGFSSSLSNPTIYKIQGGYEFDKYFALEGGYIGSTDETYNVSGGNIGSPFSASANIKGWNLTAVGMLPVYGQFSLLGKLGIASIKESADATYAGFSATASGTKTSPTYGIGVKYDFTNQFFGRFDVDSYSVGDSNYSNRNTVWTFSVGFKK